MISFVLPFPPSVNHYLGRRGKQSYKTAKAKQYNKDVAVIVMQSKANLGYNTPLEVEYYYCFPDHRKRDIANYEKVLTDSMVIAGVMKDDHIIHKLTQTKMGVRKVGLVYVTIKPYYPSTLFSIPA